MLLLPVNSQNAFNIDLLWDPRDAPSDPGSSYPPSGFPHGKQPLRRDAPHNLPSPTYPRRPPADPTDIEDYINDVRHFWENTIGRLSLCMNQEREGKREATNLEFDLQA